MLSGKQHKCAELLSLGVLAQKQIAKEINVTEQTICCWKKTDEFNSEYERLIRLNIRSAAAKAFRVHCELLKSPNDMVRYYVAKDILDRAGFKREEKVNFDVSPIVISGDSELE